MQNLVKITWRQKKRLWHKIISADTKTGMDKQQNNPSEMAGPHRDRQGVDKAPGEEQREGPIENVAADTQKGKQQVDADLDDEQDRPAPQP